MPIKYRRLSKTRVNKILKCFSADLSATQTAQITGLNRKTINAWYGRFRGALAEFQEEQVKQSSGDFEPDESYFGGPRKKTHAEDRRKRGRGAENKVPVFGIKKREDGKVYTKIIENASRKSLFPIIRDLIAKQDSLIFTDKFRTYDGLVFDGYKHTNASIIRRRIQTEKERISTVLKTSGVLRNRGLRSSMDFHERPSIFTSKNPNSDTTRSMIW